jgi:hypothetical protein
MASVDSVREFILTAHVVPVVTTKHSPAERREREPEIMHATAHPLSLPDSRSQVLSRTTNFAARIFSSGNVVCKCHSNADQKQLGALRALLPVCCGFGCALGVALRYFDEGLGLGLGLAFGVGVVGCWLRGLRGGCCCCC